MSLTTSHEIDFQPIGKRVEVTAGTSLLEAAILAGIDLTSACGGAGICGQCRVQILEGEVTPHTASELDIYSELEMSRGLRLACCTQVVGDVKVHLPRGSLLTGQRLQLEGETAVDQVHPAVTAYPITAPKPSLQDPRSDMGRIADALGEQHDLPEPVAESIVIRQLSPLARAESWRLNVFVRGREIVGFGPTSDRPLGLALDLGTTKLAGYLVDLESGGEIARGGALNSQIGYGEDVISRLAYAHRALGGREKLAASIRETIDDLLGGLATKAGMKREQVVDACIVGNTAMTHLLLELPVHQLAVAPYVPATSTAMNVKARDLGLSMAPGAFVYIPPCIGGYVGADHVAMILATGLDSSEKISLGIDIGTNTEIVLRKPGVHFLSSVSCASGPAFEGAHISDGMRAATGAIEAIELTEDGLTLRTVDDAPAVGLCGSGIIDATAELYRWHIINDRGRFQRHSKRVREGRYGLELLLVSGDESGSGRDVVITQKDVNEIQLAKGAIRAGLEVLLHATGTKLEEVEEVIIAGAFGSFLNVESAKAIGFFPPMPKARYRQVGNAAGVGAKRLLLSREVRKRARHLVEQTRYIELTSYPKFSRRFALAMLFPDGAQR